MVRGTHTIKVGAVFQYNRVSTVSETYLPGTFRFGSLPFGVFFPDPDIRTTANENPVFVQIQQDAANGVITPQFAGLLIAAVLFGVAHYAGGVSAVVLATIAGIGYGWIYWRTSRIEASILAHVLLNTTHILFFTYPARA